MTVAVRTELGAAEVRALAKAAAAQERARRLLAIALVLEVFGKAFGPPAILACGITYLITLRLKLYTEQRVSPDPLGDETG